MRASAILIRASVVAGVLLEQPVYFEIALRANRFQSAEAVLSPGQLNKGTDLRWQG